MKKIILLALALLTLGSTVEVAAQKKEKAKKEKKELKWDWDGKTLSGNAEIDTYIKTIDTLYNKVQDYEKSLELYQLRDTVLKKNGKIYRVAWMVNSEGQLLTRSRVNWQCVEAYGQGTLIALDMTNAGLMSANAALTLPQLGLKALSFGKYVKGGPAVISAGSKAIKNVRARWIENSRAWKEMKNGAIDDPQSIGFPASIKEKLNKCYYVMEITEESPYYTTAMERLTGKSAEELEKEFNSFANDVAQTVILPEDATKELEKDPDIEQMEKEMQEMEKNT